MNIKKYADVEPPFCTRFPLPSVADVMAVFCGGETVDITETVLPGD
jgi:hypothetical protein